MFEKWPKCPKVINKTNAVAVRIQEVSPLLNFAPCAIASWVAIRTTTDANKAASTAAENDFNINMLRNMPTATRFAGAPRSRIPSQLAPHR